MLTLLTAIITIIRWLEYETELEDYPMGDLYLVKPIQKYTICNYILYIIYTNMRGILINSKMYK